MNPTWGSDNRPVPVIFNPTAGGGRAKRRRDELERAAGQCGAALDFWPTVEPGHATELATRAARDALPLVFALGGDGTYNEVARGLLGSATAMGVLPAGTTSVLAYEFKIPRPVDRALEALLDGIDRTTFVGRTDQDDIFLIMLSAGPDTLVLQRLFPVLKHLGGRLGVAVQALVEIVRPGAFPQVELSTDERCVEGGWAIVGKAKCYAGPFHAVPGADPISSSLHSVVHRSKGRRAAMSFALDLARGRHVGRRDVTTVRGSRVRLAARDQNSKIAYQVDGDIAGFLPVVADIHPQPLLVRLPAPA